MNSYDLLCEAFDTAVCLEEGYSDATIAKIIKAGKGFGRSPLADAEIARNAFLKTGNMKDAVKAVQSRRLARISDPSWAENEFNPSRLGGVMKFGQKRPNITTVENPKGRQWSTEVKKAANDRKYREALTGKIQPDEYLNLPNEIKTGDIAQGIRSKRLDRINRWRQKHDGEVRKAKADELFG